MNRNTTSKNTHGEEIWTGTAMDAQILNNSSNGITSYRKKTNMRRGHATYGGHFVCVFENYEKSDSAR